MNEWSNAKLCDVANLLLGAFLVVSPWIFGFATGAPWTNAMICGLVIIVLSVAALGMFAIWEEWLNLLVGLWLMVSPWALGFAGNVAAAALNVHVVVGFLVALLAAIELWYMHQHPPRQTVGH